MLILIVSVFRISAQDVPKVILKDSKELKLSTLNVNVVIVGNLATTTYTMSFYNSENRVLEGELAFPLGEGHSVSRFAMDVNGKVREAVVVEKQLARVAFENTVRQTIDPGLLEKTQGNNYKARIYPIPAKGYKKVIIAYEQELFTKNNSHYYELPLGFKDKLDEFLLDVEVVNQSLIPVITSGKVKNIEFDKWNQNYVLNINKNNYKPENPIHIQIPTKIGDIKILTDEDGFYVYKTLSPKKRIKRKPKKVTVLWDASYSMRMRKQNEEIKLLDAYFGYLQDVEVEFISFHNSIKETKNFIVENGNFESLRRTIENTIYDGGTSYMSLDFDKCIGEEILIFTDGLDNLGSFNEKANRRVYTVNSVVSANHSQLGNLSRKSGGVYINLNRKSTGEGLEILKNEVYQFLGVSNEISVHSIYPNEKINVTKDFSLAGKFDTKKASFNMLFGYGNEVTDELKIKVDTKNSNSVASREWAKKKLNFLNQNKEENKEQIISLSKEYQLVTSYTSMLILDRVADYARYKINPPEELQAEYNKLLVENKEAEKNRLSAIETKKVELKGEYSSLWEWWNSKLIKKKQEPIIYEVEPVAIEKNEAEHEVEEVAYIIQAIPEENDASLDEVVVVGYGTQMKKEVTGSVTTVSAEMIEGQVSGVNVDTRNPLVQVRGVSSLAAGSSVLCILNGHLVDWSQTEEINPDDINSIEVLKAEDATKIYGVRASNGVVIITTKKGFEENRKEINDLEEKIASKIELKPWSPDAAYVAILKEEESTVKAYVKYIEIRNQYSNIPTFFMDIADFFENRGEKELAITILSNLIEIDLDNYELMKALAYKLEFLEMYELSLYVYKKVLELRPEEPQSYRDLALAYKNTGNYEKSFEILHRIVSGDLQELDERGRFNGIEQISYMEINNLISKHGKTISITEKDKAIYKNIPVDIRVVVDWNHNDTDIDLWVIDPNGEKCYYGHKNTEIGGRISHDMTSGYGPEEFLLKKAIKGEYKIMVDYFSDTVQKISGPTQLKVTIFTNYGKPNETKKGSVIRLDKKKEDLVVGTIKI